jgi:hypothetical protein
MSNNNMTSKEDKKDFSEEILMELKAIRILLEKLLQEKQHPKTLLKG